ncbi:MAG: RGCVC family protein [Mycobacteriales bacterium]
MAGEDRTACPACHPWSLAHDAIGRRFCAASVASELTRGCVGRENRGWPEMNRSGRLMPRGFRPHRGPGWVSGEGSWTRAG